MSEKLLTDSMIDRICFRFTEKVGELSEEYEDGNPAQNPTEDDIREILESEFKTRKDFCERCGVARMLNWAREEKIRTVEKLEEIYEFLKDFIDVIKTARTYITKDMKMNDIGDEYVDELEEIINKIESLKEINEGR